jgi:hypothetical protein
MTDPSTRGQSPESTREEGNSSIRSTRGQNTESTLGEIDPSTCGQSSGPTYEEISPSTRGQLSEPTRGQKAGKPSTFAIKLPQTHTDLRKPGSKPPVPEGFEARQRDNRWHLYRLHGKKLSANGKPMWNRSYIGSFTEEGLRSFYEREQDRIKNEPVGQRAAVVNLLDRKRSEGALGAGKKPHARRVADACDKLIRWSESTRGQLSPEQREAIDSLTLDEAIARLTGPTFLSPLSEAFDASLGGVAGEKG